MVKIGLLSDTHAWWDDRYEKYFAECDEIWHAGDIGSVQVAELVRSLETFGRYTEHRRSRVTDSLSSAPTFQHRKYRYMDNTHRGLSGPICTRSDPGNIHTPSPIIHIGSLAYLESSL